MAAGLQLREEEFQVILEMPGMKGPTLFPVPSDMPARWIAVPFGSALSLATFAKAFQHSATLRMP